MKSFVGKVVEIDNLAAHHFDYCLDSLVVVSSAKCIFTEYRCVVADSQVIAATIYKQNQQNSDITVDISAPDFQPFLDYANEVTKCWEPDRIYMLDLAEYDCLEPLKDQPNIGLMEINSFSCSGLYGCDLESVVREASRIAFEEWKDLNS